MALWSEHLRVRAHWDLNGSSLRRFGVKHEWHLDIERLQIAVTICGGYARRSTTTGCAIGVAALDI